MEALNLYEIDSELADLEAALIEAGGEIDEETEARFDALLDAREDKWRAYHAVSRRLNASAETVAAEIDRLSARHDALKRAADRVDGRLLESQIRNGHKSVESPIMKTTVSYAAPPLELLVDEAEVPTRFRKALPPPAPKADKRAIAAALKAGDLEAASVARFGERKAYLRRS